MMTEGVRRIFPRDKETRSVDPAGAAQIAGETSDDAGGKAGVPGTEDAEPGLEGKYKERPGPEEVAKSRHERKRRELVEKMEGMKKRGLGDVHPAVRSVAEALKKLAEEQGSDAGP